MQNQTETIQFVPKGFKKHSRLIMQFWVCICVCLHTGKGVNVYMSFCRWLFSLMLLAWTPTACYIMCIVCYDDLFQSAFRLEILHWGRNLCGGRRSYLNKISSFPTSNKLSLQMQGSKHDANFPPMKRLWIFTYLLQQMSDVWFFCLFVCCFYIHAYFLNLA